MHGSSVGWQKRENWNFALVDTEQVLNSLGDKKNERPDWRN